MLPSDPLVENCDYRCEECGKGAGGMTVFSMLRTLEEVSDGQKAFDLKVKVWLGSITNRWFFMLHT